MLHWFAKRLNELHKKDRKGEKGFTLIELLVVVIIIGILAAIAIPMFLAQRTRANNATAQSDLRNAAAAATSCYAKNNGNYLTPTSCTETELTANHGMNESVGTSITVDTPTASRWTASASHTGGDTTYRFDSNVGEVTASP